MRRVTVSVICLLLFLGLLSAGPVEADDEESFRRLVSTIPVLLDAINQYDADHPLLPGDTLTYGKLIENDNLPEIFCDESISRKVCGGSSVENESLHAKGPPMTMFDTFAVVRIIVPFWNIEQRHRRMLAGVLKDKPAILATWNHPEGDIPVVLTQTRLGALRSFIRYIRKSDTELSSKMSI